MSYHFYQPINNRTQQIRNENLNSDIFLNEGYINQMNSTTTMNVISFPRIKSRNNINNKVKRSNSSINLDYKFYKILKKNPLKPKHKHNSLNKYTTGTFPFYFGTQGRDDEVLKKINIIDRGNKKHEMLTYMASRREIEKIKNAKKFKKEMKIAKINLKLINQKNIEEKKIKNELINLSRNKLRKTRRYYTNIMDKKNNDSNISINSIIHNERKYVMKKGKLMHRFYEIMNNLKKEK